MANDNSIATGGVLLDEYGKQILVNTRAELVWVKATDAPHVVPKTGGTLKNVRLSDVLKYVVYDSSDQTIGGNKAFTGTTTTANVQPDGTNRNLGTPDLRYAKVYGSEINGATGTFSGNVSVGGTLGVTGATTLNSTLNAKGATTLESTLGVSGKATLSDELEVAKATTLKSTLGVTGKATLSDELEVAKATTLKSTLAVTGLITANGGIKVAKDKSYTIVDSSSKELTAITSKNASEVSLGVNTTNVSVGIYYGSTRKALVNGDGLTGANVIHSAGYAFKGKVANDNTLYEMMKMTAAKKMNVGSSNIDEIDGVIGGNVVTVTNAKGIYSNGGVAAMGIIDAGTGGGSVGKLADCSDIDKIEDGGENYVKRTEVSGTNNWKAQQGDVLYAYGEGVFKAKPLFDNNGKILVSTLPDSLLGQVLYGGNFNASGVCTLTNSFKAKYGTESLTITSTNATAYEGVFFIASASGTVAGKAVETGDWLISDGSAWQKVDNNDAVTGVKGDSETVYRTGQINITKANIGLGNVENTALSTWAGTANITTLGTITTGTWNGSKISDTYISSAATWNSKYKKPDGGIPKSDLASGVQTSLEKADSALQSHQTIYGLTIKHNGTSLGTYTPNSEAKTIEITTPTALSGFTDDATHRLVTDTQIAAWNAKWNYNADTIKAVKVTNAGNADTLESHGASYFATASGLTTANTNITTLQGYFTDGIAKKATADASGNTITSTYATKTEVSSLADILSGGVAGLDARLNDIEDWKNNPVADSFEVGMLNVTRGINLNGQDVYSADSIATLFSDGVITNRHIANGSIANNKLANSSIKIGATSVSLGGTAASLEGLTSISAGTLNGSLGKKIQFGHLNGSGAFEVDSTFNNSADLNVRIVKYGYTLPESDVNGHHRHAALVTDANGNGYIVTQLGFQVLNETYEPVPVA